ncbi:filamentous hemagglutinin N-terminal domain-containing protein [Paraburkholderia fungorum]|uniref:two-partner secretion domain-containing protein n=1 Tax=Paraburkholderia fungorum TaxID=134537 RepID=UPI0038BDB748
MKLFQGNAIAVAAMSLLAMSTNSAVAAGVVGSGGTQVSNAGATPVVNINGANAQGVSRNTFSQFDVDKNGVVFNNLVADGASQLAGKLQQNGNLKGIPASVIVADINSAQASKLNGAMEVAGGPAHLLIANAAGISCNGCNTINAPVVTLAAARFAPRADSPLALEVDTDRATPALLEINGDGMDVGAGQLNLLSRATKINGIVKGWTVNSQTGTTFEGDEHGNFKGKLTRDIDNAPAVALDVSELGGMYANKILLEGSEHGLGVNNAGVIAAGKGGLAIELFGGDISYGKDSMTGGALGTRVSAIDWANVPEDQRPEAYRGKTEEQVFEMDRQSARDRTAAMVAQYGFDKMNDLSDADKIAEVAHIQQDLANFRVQQQNDAQRAADQAAADAQHQKDLAEQAVTDAERQKYLDDWNAAQEARAQEDAKARDEARAQAEAQVRADVEARMKADAAARAEYEAQQQAEANARAADQVAAEALRQKDLDDRIAAQYASAQAEAKAHDEARAQAEAQAQAELEARVKANAAAGAEYEAQQQAQAKAQGNADQLVNYALQQKTMAQLMNVSYSY